MNRLYNELKKKKELYDDLIKIKKSVLDITSKADGKCTTEHGIRHAKRIIEYLNTIYSNYFTYYQPLNEYEIFILLAASYLHDIGFYFQAESKILEFCQWKKIDPLLCKTQNFYRKMHHQISAYWIFCNLTHIKSVPQIYFGDNNMGYQIMKVIISHGINFWEDSEYKTEVIINGHIIKEIYLSYLLCLADSMDYDKRRNYGINNFNQYPINERVFIRIHDYIDKVSFYNPKIIFNLRKPYVKAENKYTFHVFYEIGSIQWINILLNVGKTIFTDFDYSLKICMSIQECDEVNEPSEEEYEFIRKNYIK